MAITMQKWKESPLIKIISEEENRVSPKISLQQQGIEINNPVVHSLDMDEHHSSYQLNEKGDILLQAVLRLIDYWKDHIELEI